jgi:UDP-MurNAc hydroxylase
MVASRYFGSVDRMRVMLTGHAGMWVETGPVSVLCDPWFNPAYFGSWFPFPDNSAVDAGAIGSPTYLYVSHLHRDHYDPAFLAEHVSKDATVLLPEFPLDEMRRALEELGFHRFVETVDGQPVELDGIRVAICTATTPADGPLGDSTIAIDDGHSRILNQNDCRPTDIDLLGALGPYDMHLLQYSGAIWYPMTYRLDPATKAALGREKRANQMARALNYVRAVGARHVIPFAGPPAFLADELFWLNDLGGDPANIFVDQPAFLDYLAGRGVHSAHLMIPGSVADLKGGDLDITHPVGDADLDSMFTDKKAYLEAYQARRRPQFEAVVAACPTTGPDMVASLSEWIQPLLAAAPRVRAHLGGPIVLDMGAAQAVIDPAAGQVRPWRGEEWEHRFWIEERLVRSLIDRHVEDWVNELFLSCRFEAARTGNYNGTVFSLFKCLGPERMAYLEASLAPARRALTRRLTEDEKAGEGETWRCGDYLVQRRCPHLGGDLARFGEVTGKVLTCTLHGWRFDLETGRCLTADRTGLRTERVAPADGAGGADARRP